jgi:THO complex subunit 5
MANLIVSDPFLQSVLNTSTETRQQCMNLIDYSSANCIASTAHNPTPSHIQRDLTKQQKFLYGRLGQLRGLNRNAILQVRETKQITAEARQEIDRLHLHLQNLYYEERHLRGEIAACESYEYDGSL